MMSGQNNYLLSRKALFATPGALWKSEMHAAGFGSTEQEALDELIAGVLSIMETSARDVLPRFWAALSEAIEAQHIAHAQVHGTGGTQWSTHWNCCTACGGTDRRHAAIGLCERCYDRQCKAARRG